MNKDNTEALVNQFQSVFTREDTTPSSFPDLPPSPFPDMPPTTIDVEGVKKLLHNINTTKAIGPVVDFTNFLMHRKHIVGLN